MFQRHVSIFVAILILAVVSGCSTVRLISDYDETIDKGVTALQAKTEDHLSRLEAELRKMSRYNDGAPEKAALQKQVSYASSEEFYRSFLVDLRVLKARAESYDKNELTVKQFDALEEILNAQKEIHERGIGDAEDIVDMRNAFTTGFRGILKLEIAKKRGAESK